MKISFPLLLVFFLTLFSLNTTAQTNGHDFSAVDDYAKKLGTLEGMSMGTIQNVVARKFTDKMDRARVIYDWIALNISFDVKANKAGANAKLTVSDVLKTRKASSSGFAMLFQDLCSSADIRCLTVDGFLKTNTLEIGDKSTDINHTWAVVQLGESPETWFYVDPAMGSGYFGPDKKSFIPYFNTGYFFTEKNLFNWDHYPDNDAWKLGSAPRSRGDFFELPIIGNASYEYGLKSFSPKSGKYKTKATKPVNFSFRLNPNVEIKTVTVISGMKKKLRTKDVEFSFSGGQLGFTVQFEEENSYPVVIKVNGKELITYEVDVE